jgi:hypothetical protein
MIEEVFRQAGIGFEEELDSRRRTVLHADVILLAAVFVSQFVVDAALATDFVAAPVQRLLSTLRHG